MGPEEMFTKMNLKENTIMKAKGQNYFVSTKASHSKYFPTS